MKKALKNLLYIFAVYHVGLGIIGIFFTGYSELVKKVVALVFNFNLTMDAQTIWMLKPIAAYMLAMGIIAFFAAKKPENFKPIIFAIAGFIAVRAIQRIIFAVEGNEFMLNADPIRNIVVILILSLYSASIFIFAKKA